MSCIFCQIASGEIPSHRIAESERAIAFLDINPGAIGHVVVAARAHAANLHEISADDLAACAILAQEVAARLSERLDCDGVSIVQSNGAAAGQTVFHYHVHVIPRDEGDSLRTMWQPTHPDAGSLASIEARLTAPQPAP